MFDRFESDKITLLCGNKELVNQVLGIEDESENDIKKNDKNINQPTYDRAIELVNELKTYLLQMVAEAEEYDDPNETLRLQAESVGILISMREIIRHFPEIKKR